MAKDPKRPNQDHWFDIANQIGSDSAGELDDYFSGAAAEPMESIDSILKEVEGDDSESSNLVDGDAFNEPITAENTFSTENPLDATAEFQQEDDTPETMANVQASDDQIESDDDPLDIDWGQPPKRDYSKNLDEPTVQPSDSEKRSLADSTDTESEIQPKHQVQPQENDQHKTAGPSSVDSWDILADDLGIERPSEAEATAEEADDFDDGMSTIFEKVEQDPESDLPLSPIFEESESEQDSDKLDEAAANDVLSQMFAFGDPNENRDTEKPTKQSLDTSTEQARDEIGFEFNSSQFEETEEPAAAVDSEIEENEEFIEFEVESLTDSSGPSQNKSRRRRGRRSRRDASVESDSPDNESEFDDAHSPEREEKPSSRRRRRGAQDSREESRSRKEDKRDQQSGSKKAAKKPTESKSHKRDLDTNEPERKKKKIPTWGEAIDFLIDKNLQNRKKPGNSGRKRRRR